MRPPDYEWLKRAGWIINSGQARTILMTGNVADLVHDGAAIEPGAYCTLVDRLSRTWDVTNVIVVVYELNGPVRFLRKEHRETVRDAWTKMRHGIRRSEIAAKKATADDAERERLVAVEREFDDEMHELVERPAMALEVLRQMCQLTQSREGGKPIIKERMIVIVEHAHMLLPDAPIAQLSEPDRHRVMLCTDWFSDPGFMGGNSTVVLVSESRAKLNAAIGGMQQVMEVEVPAPDKAARLAFLQWFRSVHADRPVAFWGSDEEFIRFTGGLTLLAMQQLLLGAAYEAGTVSLKEVIGKVEEFIKSQLPEGTVTFKKPKHRMKDLIGISGLRKLIDRRIIPRIRSTGKGFLSGIIVPGPIGAGKTFIFEALAGELDMPVMELANLRSKWFGETDVTIGRLRRVLEAIDRVMIFIDEADTVFGGLGADVHETERRLTGKIQGMMSDPILKDRVVWVLMTARPHLLSADIRRPGRGGNMIIPVLDPEGDDAKDFVRWAVEPSLDTALDATSLEALLGYAKGYSAASFQALREELAGESELEGRKLTFEEVKAVLEDILPSDIALVREYQKLQALLNCTRRSNIPGMTVTDDERAAWRSRVRDLEAQGIR